MRTYSFGHTNTSVPNRQGFISFVWNDVDAEVFARIQLAGVGQSLIANFVQGIRTIRDQLTQEDLFIRIDSVDDQREELRDLGCTQKLALLWLKLSSGRLSHTLEGELFRSHGELTIGYGQSVRFVRAILEELGIQ